MSPEAALYSQKEREYLEALGSDPALHKTLIALDVMWDSLTPAQQDEVNYLDEQERQAADDAHGSLILNPEAMLDSAEEAAHTVEADLRVHEDAKWMWSFVRDVCEAAGVHIPEDGPEVGTREEIIEAVRKAAACQTR